MSAAAHPPRTAPPHAVRCLKSDGSRGVWLVRRPGKETRVLKTWPLTPWMMVKLILGIAQPQRQWRGGRRLRAAGLNSPLVHQWRMRFRLPWRVELELDYIEGRSLWEIYRASHDSWKTSPVSAIDLAARLGAMVAHLARAGVFHRDLKLDNIIAERDDLQRLWLIDPVGVRRMRRRPEEIARMLERLGVQPLGCGMRLPHPVLRAAIRAATSDMSRSERRSTLQALRTLAPESHRRESNS